MRRWGLIAVALLSAVWAVLVLPHSADPRGFSDLTVTKTARANAYRGDGFDYTISDGNGGTDTGHVDVSVLFVNQSPVANDDVATA